MNNTFTLLPDHFDTTHKSQIFCIIKLCQVFGVKYFIQTALFDVKVKKKNHFKIPKLQLTTT